MVMTPDSQQVEVSNTGFCFLKEKPSLISLILNTKSEKNTIMHSAMRHILPKMIEIANKIL